MGGANDDDDDDTSDEDEIIDSNGDESDIEVDNVIVTSQTQNTVARVISENKQKAKQLDTTKRQQSRYDQLKSDAFQWIQGKVWSS